MNAHDYQGDGETCSACQRPPGNYIHIGLSDADVAEWPEHHPLVKHLNVETRPSLALMDDEEGRDLSLEAMVDSEYGGGY